MRRQMLESDSTVQRGVLRQTQLGEELQRRVRARADVLRLQRDVPKRREDVQRKMCVKGSSVEMSGQ